MVKRLEDVQSGTVGFEASAKLTREDYLRPLTR
jgi:hypothetical protein